MPKDIEALTGTDLTDFKAAMASYLGTKRTSCQLKLNANQAIASATTTIVSWTAEVNDADGIVAVPATYVTVPAGMTQCRVAGQAIFAPNATGLRHVVVMHRNTSDVLVSYILQSKVATVPVSGEAAALAVASAWRDVTAGNRIAVAVEHTSGGSLNLLGFATETGGVSTMMEFEFR